MIGGSARRWARLSFTDGEHRDGTLLSTELAPADREADCGDAQLVLSWLRSNTLTEELGVDPDMLVQLFIEAAVSPGQGSFRCGGEFLATLSGTAEWAGTAADSRWSLDLDLGADVVEAVLGAIADSGPRWRYAIVAARDPQSPAGRVRRTVLGQG